VGEKNAYPLSGPRILATGVTLVAANEYRYCLHGDDYGFAGDCAFTSYQQCQATASGRTAYCEVNPYLANAAVPTVPRKASSLTLLGSPANQMAWSTVCRKARNRSGDRGGQVWSC
jgi:hypothetical protein